MEHSTPSIRAYESVRRGPSLYLRLGVMATLLLSQWAQAETWPASPPVLSDKQINVAYSAARVIGALQIVYFSKEFSDQGTAQAALDKLTRLRDAGAVRLGFQKSVQPCFAIPAAERLILLNGIDHHPSQPFEMNGKWWVVMRTGLKFDGIPALPAIRDKLPEYVRIGAIPDPDQILQPPLVTQFAAGTVHDVESLHKLQEPYDVDMVLPNGNTLLIASLYMHKDDLTAELLKRGANPNKCSAGICPLHAAVLGENAPTMVKLLLDHGSDPDVMDRSAGVHWTPLVHAMLHSPATPLVELLAQSGADVNGKDGDVTPLMMAAERADRDAVSYLQQKNVDWFRVSKDEIPARNAQSFAATGKGDAAFKEWFAKLSMDAAARSGLYEWEGWIEQDGHRWHIGNEPVKLQRKPFDIVVNLQPRARLLVVAGEGDGVFKELQRGYNDGRIFSAISIAADAGDGTSRDLFVNGQTLSEGEPYTVQSWADVEGWKTFSAVRKEGSTTKYVRTVAQLNTASGTQSLAQSGIHELHLVLGTQLDMAFPRFDYYRPQRLNLLFK
ncbi:MAG TPA: ankyrin repeat domain-containing protein [Steroidobacteraceae bacterium]|nr:ankyrin repeat domain-containing protein [Steroidobacteraceae bacterium]